MADEPVTAEQIIIGKVTEAVKNYGLSGPAAGEAVSGIIKRSADLQAHLLTGGDVHRFTRAFCDADPALRAQTNKTVVSRAHQANGQYTLDEWNALKNGTAVLER
ncbi:MAG: hypothetical protein ABSE73_16570 [Planctomycetota bacterium]